MLMLKNETRYTLARNNEQLCQLTTGSSCSHHRTKRLEWFSDGNRWETQIVK
jgi:hypothetical protein